jgi:ADP-ribosylglycohydrolase
MTSTLLLGLVTSSLEATIYLFYNGRVSDDFNLTARLSNFLVRSNHLYSIMVVFAMTSTLLLALVTSSFEATTYLFYNGHVSDDFNLTARLSNFLVRSNHLSIL